MLSLSNGGMSSGQAGRYFAREDYYLRGGESSRWLGKGAERLKLQGTVREDEFRQVSAGKSPDGSQLVAPKVTKDGDGNRIESHRAGNDLTFSAPKSVSIGYAAGNHELKEVWDRAVENTMHYIEEHYSQYRTPDGVETAGNIVAAKFDHVSSRALDPEVHSHVFLHNMLLTRRGEWLANEPKNIYADKIALGTLARQEAIHLYRQAGYQVRFTDRERLLFEIAGVRQEEIEAFSRRSAAIAAKVSEWKAEGKFPGASDTILKQMAALDTRNPKRQVTREDVRREWDRGFAAAGTTAEEVRGRIEASRDLQPEQRMTAFRYLAPGDYPPSLADGINHADVTQNPSDPENLQARNDKEPSVKAPMQTLDAIRQSYSRNPECRSADQVLKEAAGLLTDKEAVFERGDLLKTAAQLSGGHHSIAELDAADGSRTLRALGREPHGWKAGKEFYTTEEMMRLEARNLARLKSLGEFRGVTSKEEVLAYLRGLAGEEEKCPPRGETPHPAAYRAGVAAAEATEPVTLSPGQREHVLNELAGGKGFTVTQGDPGTGKTFASQIVERYNAEVLEPSGRRHVALDVAYTGKAALEMEKASGRQAYTIDSFLNRYNQSPDPASILGTDAAGSERVQVVVKIDEASFVGGRQAEHLLNVVQDLRAKKVAVKMSLIGDYKQMQSIQASPFFSHATELARDGHGDFAVMKEITRQKEPGLLEVARLLNSEPLNKRPGTVAADALQMLNQQGRVTEMADRRDLVRAAVDRYLDESKKPHPDPAAERKRTALIVVPVNADRKELNAAVREARKAKGEIESGKTLDVLVQVESGVTVAGFRPGTVVAFGGQRDKSGRVRTPEGIVPNQQGKVVAADPGNDTVTVSLSGGERVFKPSELNQGVTLYRIEQREFSVGDQVVFGKNIRDRSISPAAEAEKEKGAALLRERVESPPQHPPEVPTPAGRNIPGVRNGERGVIETLAATDGGYTTATVRMTDGRRLKVELDRFGPQYLDHGYAVTPQKGQGETVDSVVLFNYVQPPAQNDPGVFRCLADIKMDEKTFEEWNGGLSDRELSYRRETGIGGHAGTLSFVVIESSRNPRPEKGVAIEFHEGFAVVGDETARSRMRAAGMYWSKDLNAWVTSVTNEKAMGLMTDHPLKDPHYLDHLRETLGKEGVFQPPPVPGEGERNYTTAIDTAAEVDRFGRASFNSFNVAITRARYEGAVYTNSLPGLKKAVQVVDSKSSTIGRHLQEVQEPEKTARQIHQPSPQPMPQPSAATIPKPELELTK